MDIQYLLFLQDLREWTGGIFNSLATQISDLSYGIFIWLAACIFFWGVNKRQGYLLFLNVGLSRFLMQFLKLTFCVYRPYIRSAQLAPLEEASGYSFPSGHSVTAAANYGTLMRCFKKYRFAVVFFAVMIILTVFSRNYIGVHTPQDVIVGMLLGLAVVVFAPMLWDKIEKCEEGDYIILAGGIILTVIFILYISLKSYPEDLDENGKIIVDSAKMIKDGYKDAGRFFGLTLGLFIERRFVKFSTEVSVYQRVKRCLVGVSLLIVLEKTLIPAVAGLIGSWGYFIMMAFELFVLVAAYPMLFKAIERRNSAKK